MQKSTVNVATLAGITVRYLEMIEAGTKTPSLPTLRRIAQVLGVQVSALVGGAPSENDEGPAGPRLAAVERALFTYRSVSLGDRDVPLDLPGLACRLGAAWEAWDTSHNRYTDVLGVLPELIIDVERAVAVSGRSGEACRLAAEVYQLSRELLRFGRADLCPLVGDRAMRYAEETGDPVLMGTAARNIGLALLSGGMAQGALDVAMVGAEKLERLLPDGTPQLFSVYGGLLQVAAVASGRTGDPWRARELLRGPAWQAALRVGEGHDFHHIAFGPGNVGIHQVSIEVEAGEFSAALRVADEVNTSNIASIGRRAYHLGDLEMIEAGTRSPSMPVLRRIARMLGVRTSILIGAPPSEDHEGPINPRLAELERALITYRTLTLSDPAEVPELGELAQRVEASWDAWLTSPNKYSDVLRVLPELIVHSERAVHEQGRSPQACRLACEVYQLARPVVTHLGRVDLGARVADRGLRYAQETEDPVLVGAATWNLSLALLADDMPHGALDIATRAAKKLEPSLPDATPEHLSLYGGLVQLAAVAQVRTGEPRRARELLRDARLAADRVGDGSDYHHIFFGPTNVGIHATSVELEAGEISEGLRMAGDVDIARIGSLERKTAHLYQVASAYEYQGNDPAVLVHLTMAERICPQDFRCRQTVRNMVSTLVRRARPSYASEVRELAARIGMLD